VNVYRNTDRQAHLAYARSTKYFSDLRVVYEIQSKLRQDNQLPTAPEGTLPGIDAAKRSWPDRRHRTGNTTAAETEQNDVNSQLQVLAEELPILSGNFSVLIEGRSR